MRIRREAACTVSPAADGKMVDPCSASARWTASSSPSPNVVGDGIQVSCPSSLRKGGVLARPWDCALCLRRCFSHRRWTSGLLVGGEGLLFPFPSLCDGGRCSFSIYDACWRSRRWFMRQIHALEPFMEEDGGSTLVGALVAGDRKLRAVARSWGCCDVNSSYSRVFLANFQGCTVLFY